MNDGRRAAQLTNRRTFVGALAAGAASLATCKPSSASVQTSGAAPIVPIAPPNGQIPTAILIDEGAEVIDFAGPWETLQAAGILVPGFQLYTVAGVTTPITASGGLKITPDYNYQNAPPPKVVVMGAQMNSDLASKVAWIRSVAENADVVMSVCTGAFLLAQTGLLDGLSATTHHGSYDSLERQYAGRIRVLRNRRFVDNGKFITAGGLTSGIDASLHVISRYYGMGATQRIAAHLEHDSDGWRSGVQST